MTYPQHKEWVPRALWGAPLEGSKPVRYVYVDESGISANEPVSVVAGVVVHPDTQWRAVETAINAALDEYVPPELRKGFVFHALQVFGGGENREIWPKDSRWKLLDTMLGIPRRFRLPITYGIVRRGRFAADTYDLVAKSKHYPMTLAEFDHAMAFHMCVGSADKYLRKRTAEGEVATLVVEDIPEMRKVLTLILHLLRTDTFTMPPELLRHDVTDITPEKIEHGEEIKVTRIVDTPHFVPKRGSPLLQLADACAFGVRRWISRQSRGDELMTAILGQPPHLPDFSGPSSFGFWAD